MTTSEHIANRTRMRGLQDNEMSPLQGWGH